MRRQARITIDTTIDLADPDDYPEGVTSWEGALREEVSHITLVHHQGVDVAGPATYSYDLLFDPTADLFIRSEP